MPSIKVPRSLLQGISIMARNKRGCCPHNTFTPCLGHVSKQLRDHQPEKRNVIQNLAFNFWTTLDSDLRNPQSNTPWSNLHVVHLTLRPRPEPEIDLDVLLGIHFVTCVSVLYNIMIDFLKASTSPATMAPLAHTPFYAHNV